MTIFLRILDASIDDKPAELRRTVTALHEAAEHGEALQRVVFELESSPFSEIPGSPFAYWVGN
jgi:hypothetical protein